MAIPYLSHEKLQTTLSYPTEKLNHQEAMSAMSSSTAATATTCVSQPLKIPPLSAFNFPSKSLPFPRNPRRLTLTINSGDVPTETTTAAADRSESLESPPVSPSLISVLNVERALRGIAITDVDHYGRLGIPRKCPYDQVTSAYVKKVDELKSQELDEEEMNKQLQLLKDSYTILSTVEERRLYDWSLSRSERPDRYAWPFEDDITQTSTRQPPPPEPEDVGPTRAVGYFMLGWLVLSVVLSVALNR